MPISCLIIVTATAVAAADLYVSPAGDDGNSGSGEAPLASVEAALTRVRDAGPATIWLAPGEYHVPTGLSLDRSHGGTAEAPLTIRAMVPHTARISGSRPVTGFQPIAPEDARSLISEAASKNVLVADLKGQGFPALAPLPKKFRAPGVEEVIYGAMPMQPARWPNEGFTSFTEVIDGGASDPIHWATREVYRPGSFRFPNDRPASWDLSRGVYLHGFWCYEWADEVLQVATYDADSRELRFAGKHQYGIGNPFNKQAEREFYAIHVFEELDCPGEYYLDRQNNRLFFWPPGDVDKTPVHVSLCRVPLLRADAVANLVLRDLVFENGCSTGIQLRDCTNTTIENCLVRNMGLAGITSSGGSDNHVLRCEVTRTGSMGVSMAAGDRKSLTNGNCSVVGNHLHHLGRYDWMAGRAVFLEGCGNRMANNLIHHCPTGAVLYGGNEHILELNEIHNVCLLYSDVGVFYTGRDWASRGNIVRWNYIHSSTNNPGVGSGSQAFYLDDCDSGDTVLGNIVFGGVGRGVLLGGGRDNNIRGNIFIGVPRGIHVDARGPGGITFDKPGSWNLKAKCEELGYLSPTWKARYPKLATVMQEQPLLPMGNVMDNNIFIECKTDFALADDVKEEWLTRSNNHTWQAKDFPFLPLPGGDAPLDLQTLPRIWSQVPGFEAIPFDKIGPQGL